MLGINQYIQIRLTPFMPQTTHVLPMRTMVDPLAEEIESTLIATFRNLFNPRPSGRTS